MVPAEVPIAISFLGIGYAVMMATPSDLEDFAIGFARSERLIESAADVIGIEIRPRKMAFCSASSLRTSVTIGCCSGCAIASANPPAACAGSRISSRRCGRCRSCRRRRQSPPTAIFRALEAIRAHQPLNAETGAVHAAALCDAAGEVIAAREDVGRHNAFDKLVGHCLREGRDMSAGFVLLTARCSYELVEKAALAGVPLLVTISAPTSLAIARAEEAGLTLIALARSDSVLVMTDPHGLFADPRVFSSQMELSGDSENTANQRKLDSLPVQSKPGTSLVQLEPRPDDHVDAGRPAAGPVPSSQPWTAIRCIR